MQSLPNPVVLAEQCRKRFFDLNTDVDHVVTDDPVHIGYLSGYRSILHDTGVYRQVLIASRDSMRLVTGASDAAAALEALGNPEQIHRYGTFYVSGGAPLPGYGDLPAAGETYDEAVSPLLEALAKQGGRIALDLHGKEISHMADYHLSAARCVAGGQAFQRARAVKLPGELDVLRYASRLTAKAVASVAEMARPGTTELEVAAEIGRQLLAGGAIPRFLVATSGERSSRVDAYASGKHLADGDLLRLDVGASVNGYQSDMARTYGVGNAGVLAASRYDALLAGELAELDMVRPGAIAGDIFDAAIAKVREGALPSYQRNHCGHGIGLKAHEFPVIGPRSETALEAGMVLCLETPYYEIGWGGMMVEDTVIVTDTGYEHLTDIPNSLKPLQGV